MDLGEKELRLLLDEVSSCNGIRYAAYRTASKLCVLQKGLGLKGVSLETVRGILEQHQIFATDNSSRLDINEVLSILHDIYFVISKNSSDKIDINSNSQMTLKFMHEICGKVEGDLINVLHLKVGLTALCDSPLQMKYQYWFAELANHNLCLPRRRLQSLLECLLSIVDVISESNTFSPSLIGPTLDSCYSQNSSLGITEGDFMTWILREPQLLVWLSTFYRLRASGKVIHRVRCAVCRSSPIVGLRYHCLCCICYDLCQNCFFTAKTSKRHKTSHMIREYCTEITSYETTVSFLKGILSKLCGTTSKLQYLPVSTNCSQSNMLSDSEEPNLNGKQVSSILGRKRSVKQHMSHNQTAFVQQLEEIICQIEAETRLLRQAIGKESASSLINKHAYFLNEQLNRLRTLQVDTEIKNKPFYMSTPITNYRVRTDLELSSILLHSDNTLQTSDPSGFSSWLKSSVQEENHTQQVEADLDQILKKLQNMLETSFSITEKN